MNAFLENPEQYELLVDDPEGRIAGATEEILRWASPVMYFRRNATKDFELRGQTIKAGDKISLWYVSGNRDEDVFDDPFRSTSRRDPNPHIAFGGGGPHFCLGAQLARMEIHVLFEELAKRVPRVEQLGAPDRLRSNFIGGIKHLPVRFHERSGIAGSRRAAAAAAMSAATWRRPRSSTSAPTSTSGVMMRNALARSPFASPSTSRSRTGRR